jgi:hypothetical protein
MAWIKRKSEATGDDNVDIVSGGIFVIAYRRDICGALQYRHVSRRAVAHWWGKAEVPRSLILFCTKPLCGREFVARASIGQSLRDRGRLSAPRWRRVGYVDRGGGPGEKSQPIRSTSRPVS